MPAPMSGRKAEAARNDGLILDAAREVFLADPGAPIAAVAARAGVGISALYRRYPSKEELLRELARDGLTRFKQDLEIALAAPGSSADDAWAAYRDCLVRVLDGRSQGLAQRLAGTFTPTSDLGTLAWDTGELYAKLHRRTQRAKALRRDVTTADVILLLEMLMLIDLPGESDVPALRRRYLALVLEALRVPDAGRPLAALPGPAADDAVLGERWRR